jgi:hypothetical protein
VLDPVLPPRGGKLEPAGGAAGDPAASTRWRAAGWAGPLGCWLLEWPSGVRQRGFIDYDSDAIRLRNPNALCRLT